MAAAEKASIAGVPSEPGFLVALGWRDPAARGEAMRRAVLAA